MRVWLPWDRPTEFLGELPAGVKVDVFHSGTSEPDSVAEVEFYVPDYMASNPRVIEVIGEMPALRVLQTQTAGYENFLPHVRDGVTLCNARGVHDASSAELAMALILASYRRIPPAVRGQDRGEWISYDTFDDSLAERTVLIVGYGSIGETLESRLTPFECEVLRVARRERPGVAPVERLPELLPRADVVELMTPATPETVGLVDADFLGH